MLFRSTALPAAVKMLLNFFIFRLPSDKHPPAATAAVPTQIIRADTESSRNVDFITHPFRNARPNSDASDEYEIPEVNSDKFLPIIPLILAGLIPGMNMNKTANRTAIRSTMYNLPVTPEPSVLLFFEMSVSFISPFPFFFGFRQHPELFENV